MAKLLTIAFFVIFGVLGLGLHLIAEGIAGAMDNSANRIAAARGE